MITLHLSYKNWWTKTVGTLTAKRRFDDQGNDLDLIDLTFVQETSSPLPFSKQRNKLELTVTQGEANILISELEK